MSGVAQFNVFGLGFSLYGVFLLVSRAAATARRSEDPDLGLSMDDGAAIDFVAKRKAFSHLVLVSSCNILLVPTDIDDLVYHRPMSGPSSSVEALRRPFHNANFSSPKYLSRAY